MSQPNIPADDPCPGSCNREFRAAEETGPDHDVPFHPGRPMWCTDVYHVRGDGEIIVTHHGCTERITSDLRAIPDLATNLTPGPLNTPRDVKADDRGIGSNTLVHPPTNSPGWDTADEVIRWAIDLEDDLRDRLNQTSRRGDAWRDLTSAVRFLAAYSAALLSGPDAERIGRQIMHHHRALERVTGADQLVHRLPGPCLRCDRKGLERADGGELVKCRHCRATWAWEQYEWLSKAYADNVKREGA